MKTTHYVTIIVCLIIAFFGELYLIDNLQDKVERLEESLDECRDENSGNSDPNYVPGRVLKRYEYNSTSKSQKRPGDSLDYLKYISEHPEEFDNK